MSMLIYIGVYKDPRLYILCLSDPLIDVHQFRMYD